MAVPGVTNSEGGGASFSRSAVALATSNGFYGRYAGTSHSIGVAVLAGEGTGMERDHDFAMARHAADLESAAIVGQRAGQRAVERIAPRKAKSQSVPVVFDPREAASLVGHFAGARSQAPRSRVEYPFSKNAWANQFLLRAYQSSTIHTGSVACAPNPLTVKASPIIAAL